MYNADVCRSLAKTKHRDMLVELILSACNCVPRNIQRKVSLYDRREHNIVCLRFLFGTYDWSTMSKLAHIGDTYGNFVRVVKDCLIVPISSRTVTVCSRDPFYITPLVSGGSTGGQGARATVSESLAPNLQA
jgi:hypothetical protein